MFTFHGAAIASPTALAMSLFVGVGAIGLPSCKSPRDSPSTRADDGEIALAPSGNVPEAREGDAFSATEAHHPISAGAQRDAAQELGASSWVGPTSPMSGSAASALAALGRGPLPSLDERPTVVVGAPRVLGGPLGDVDPAIKRMRAGFRACYAHGAAEAEELPDASAFSLHLFVMPNGSVRSVTAEGASGIAPAAVECIVRRAQMTTFPASMGAPVEIVLPLSLHP
jgi:hypothetical protein